MQTISHPMDTGNLSQEVKWLEHDTDYSPPTSAEIKNMWSYTAIPPFPAYITKVWCLIKHRNNFTFYPEL